MSLTCIVEVDWGKYNIGTAIAEHLRTCRGRRHGGGNVFRTSASPTGGGEDGA